MWKVLLFTWFVGICSSVVSCPHHCECYIEEKGLLHTANCSGSALTTALTHPNHSHPHIDVLNIRPHFKAFRTKLSPSGFRSFKNIKFLNLSNTSIDNLPNGVFHGLNYILTIDLNYNKIKRLNGGVFKELSTLQTLLLRGNPLILTNSDVIVSKSLRTLDLGYCGLRNIYPYTFAHVKSLSALFLDGNSLQTIGYKTVPSGVSYLNLANNHIVHVPTDVLQSLRSLNRLDMSGNPVQCTCSLLLLQDTFSGQGRIFENDIICSSPRQFHGQKLSRINENYLCNLEFKKKDRYMNDIKHFRDVRSFRKHNMIQPPSYDDNFGIQGDQPRDMTLSDELTPSHHDTEVMFSNDDTLNMGTHMATNSFTQHHPKLYEISEENNKLTLPTTDHDQSLKDNDFVSNEDEDTPEELNLDGMDDDISNNSSKNEAHSIINDSVEEFNENEPSSKMDHQASSTEKTEENNSEASSTLEETKAKRSSTETDMFESSVHTPSTKENIVSVANDSEHTVEVTSSEDFSENTESTLIHEVEELSPSHSHNYTNDVFSRYTDHEHNHTTSDAEDDKDTSVASSLHSMETFTSDEPQDSSITDFEHTKMSSVDDIFSETITTSGPDIEPYTWPSSKSDMTDYNYDAQHDDYSSVDPLINHSVNTTDETLLNNSNIPLTTETYSVYEEKSSTEQTLSSSALDAFDTDEEGSGAESNETLSEEDKATVQWMDAQENETSTADYSVETVSHSFNITSEDRLAYYTSENASSTEITDIIEDITTELPTESSSVSDDSEIILNTTAEESTTEEINTTVVSISEDTSPVQVTSEETTASSLDNETQTFTHVEENEEEETTYFTSEETTTIETLTSFEESSSESSSTAADISSSSYSPPIEITSESVTKVSATSEETTPEVLETSTDSSPTPLYIPEVKEEDEEDEKKVEISSSTTEATVTSDEEHPVIVDEKEGHSSTISSDISSSTPVSEVEFVSKSVHVDDKENMILDPTNEEISKSEEQEEGPNIAMIGIIVIILLLILIVLIISMAVVCRRSKRPKNKIRLPADPEANLGTEMQDMLLPKPPENGVKVVPKNYTNGTTAAATANGNSNKPEQQKEEETPVLAAAEQEEDTPLQESDWDEKPEPIETVTARLSMLARPQTPVFIPKTLN